MLFSQRLVGRAEVAIVVLLVCLAAVLARLAPRAAGPASPADRWTLHGPVAVLVVVALVRRVRAAPVPLAASFG